MNKTVLSEKAENRVEERRRFISEAFHSFHQPLTALHCGLELTLLKNRAENEYRNRAEEALSHAGAVLELNKAVRELVESADPGENCGRVELKPLLDQLISELTIPAEAAMVSVGLECPDFTCVRADGLKLAQNIGNLASQLIRSAEPGGSIRLRVRDGAQVTLEMILKAKSRSHDEDGLQAKLDHIRVDSACSYIWTLGGDFRKTKTGYSISLARSE